MKTQPPIKQKWIKNPEDMLSMWEAYRQEVDSNPDEQEVATGKGVMTIKVKRPYLRQGFEAFVYRNYGHHIGHYFDELEGYEAYFAFASHIRAEITANQLDGGLTGRLKAPNLIARLNGLADLSNSKVDTTVSQTMKIEYVGHPGNDPIEED